MEQDLRRRRKRGQLSETDFQVQLNKARRSHRNGMDLWRLLPRLRRRKASRRNNNNNAIELLVKVQKLRKHYNLGGWALDPAKAHRRRHVLSSSGSAIYRPSEASAGSSDLR